jgi:hypothetical protein
MMSSISSEFFSFRIRVENGEFGTNLVDGPFHVLHSTSFISAFAGHHKCDETSLFNGLQKPIETGTLVVKHGSDVSGQMMLGIVD